MEGNGDVAAATDIKESLNEICSKIEQTHVTDLASSSAVVANTESSHLSDNQSQQATVDDLTEATVVVSAVDNAEQEVVSEDKREISPESDSHYEDINEEVDVNDEVISAVSVDVEEKPSQNDSIQEIEQQPEQVQQQVDGTNNDNNNNEGKEEDDDDYEDIEEDDDGDYEDVEDENENKNEGTNDETNIDKPAKAEDTTEKQVDKETNQEAKPDVKEKSPTSKADVAGEKGAALVVPKKGNFYEHDNRADDEEDEAKEAKGNLKNTRNLNEKWQHDLFNPNQDRRNRQRNNFNSRPQNKPKPNADNAGVTQANAPRKPSLKDKEISHNKTEPDDVARKPLPKEIDHSRADKEPAPQRQRNPPRQKPDVSDYMPQHESEIDRLQRRERVPAKPANTKPVQSSMRSDNQNESRNNNRQHNSFNNSNRFKPAQAEEPRPPASGHYQHPHQTQPNRSKPIQQQYAPREDRPRQQQYAQRDTQPQHEPRDSQHDEPQQQERKRSFKAMHERVQRSTINNNTNQMANLRFTVQNDKYVDNGQQQHQRSVQHQHSLEQQPQRFNRDQQSHEEHQSQPQRSNRGDVHSRLGSRIVNEPSNSNNNNFLDRNEFKASVQQPQQQQQQSQAPVQQQQRQDVPHQRSDIHSRLGNRPNNVEQQQQQPQQSNYKNRFSSYMEPAQDDDSSITLKKSLSFSNSKYRANNDARRTERPERTSEQQYYESRTPTSPQQTASFGGSHGRPNFSGNPTSQQSSNNQRYSNDARERDYPHQQKFQPTNPNQGYYCSPRN